MYLDKEYQTCFLKEVEFLTNKGIRYSFVKTIEGSRVYKYTKTPKLFSALSLFYCD
jgi:hypothetical protein